MRKPIFVVSFILIVFLFSSCQIKYFFTHPKANFTEEYIKSQNQQYSVEIPEVFELVNVAYALTKNGQKHPWMVNKKRYYFNEVRNYFADFTTHPLILKLNEKVATNYQYYFEERDNAYCYEFHGDSIVKNNYKNLHGIYNISSDIELWQDFAKTSKFKRFYEFHKEEYQTSIDNIKKNLELKKMWSWLESNFSEKYNSYKLVISPLIYGSHSISRVNDKGFNECVVFVSDTPRDTTKHTPEVFKGLYARVVFTEIDHNYVNPVSAKFKKDISAAITDLKKWNKSEKSFTSKISTFNEYMTWAVFNLYLKVNFSQEAFEKVNSETNQMMANYRGCLKFKEFNAKLLDLYETVKPKNLEEIYPAIIKWMGEQQ